MAWHRANMKIGKIRKCTAKDSIIELLLLISFVTRGIKNIDKGDYSIIQNIIIKRQDLPKNRLLLFYYFDTLI